MGMSASQSRFLQLTSRKANIELQEACLSRQKQALARDMTKVSEKYNTALSSKVYKWTNNGGATYTNFSYTSLMTPSIMNQNNTYLITDLNGKVVVNSQYAEYAEMISPDGAGGADWSGDTRYNILAKLTGISADKLKSQDELYLDCCQKEEALNAAEAKMPQKASYSPKTSLSSLFSKAGIEIKDGGSYSPDEVISAMKNILPYLGGSDNKTAFSNALKYMAGYSNTSITGDNSNTAGPFSGEGKDGKYTLNLNVFMSTLIRMYKLDGGEVISSSESDGYNNGNEYNIIWYNPEDYQKYETAFKNWETTVYTPAKEAFDAASDAYSQLFTAEEKNQIEFYDRIFSAIAEQGWVYNSSVDDPAYLNEMLQNNQYMITTVERSSEYDGDSNKCISENSYSDTIASNFNKLVAVNDSDARAEAEAEYEHEKRLISLKESAIDTRMKNLETTLASINQMLEGINNVKKENIDRTFKIFG